MKYAVYACMIVWFTSTAPAQSGRIEIGGPAPPLSLEMLLQAPRRLPLKWSDLRGQSLVIDFWGTWCGPCIRTIPHMNRMAREFKEQPIQFLAVTDEDRSTVESFVKTHGIDAWIGLDLDGSMFDDYGVWSVPFTVLVDSSGVVRDVTHPVEVTAEKLSDLIQDRLRVKHKTIRHQMASRILVLPSRISSMLRRESRKGVLELVGYPFPDLISAVYGYPKTRIRMKVDPPEDRYDVLIPPGQGKVGVLLLKKILEASMGFRARPSVEEVEVLTLEKSDSVGRPPEVMSGSDAKAGSVRERKWFKAGDTMELASFLEAELGIPVIDRSGVKTGFPVEIERGRNSLQEQLSRLGLILKPGRESLEFLYIEKP